MPRFKYIAVDGKGSEKEGVIDADSKDAAVSQIRRSGLYPTQIGEVGAATQSRGAAAQAQSAAKPKSGKSFNIALFGRRVKAKEKMVFTRQLATLVQAGLPLLRGLRILLKQEKNVALREALTGMGESVEGGSTFSEALSLYPRIFDNLFVNMVRAGEAGGVLDDVLNRLAEFMEKAEKIKNKVRGAMTYPIVVLIAAMGILIFLLIKVIPQFRNIFKDLLGDQPLPALTEFVIQASNLVRTQSLLVIAVVVSVVVLVKLWRRTERGRILIDKAKLKAPLFGTLVLKTAVARFSRTLGTLMGAGVPVLQSLNIVRDTAGNCVVAKAIEQVHDSVKEGDTMALPLEACGVFPGMVVSMVDVGEETGALPEMLVRIADSYDDDVDSTVDGLTSVIEPILIIMLALIIGTIVIAMFVPMIEIIGKLGR